MISAQQKALFCKPYVQYFNKNACTGAFSQTNEHRVCSFMVFVQGATFLRFSRLGASWAGFSRHGASWAWFPCLGPPACNKNHYFTNPMFNISVKAHSQVRFLKIMNIGFVVSWCSCREQSFYDFRALGRPGQDFRAMGRPGLDFRALGHPPATKSMILQTLCSIFWNTDAAPSSFS